jgi:hypothetical protein
MRNKFIIIICIAFLLPMIAMAEDLVVLKDKADKILHSEVMPNLKVRAMKDGQEISEKNQENAVVVQSVNYAGLEDFNNQEETVISFSGSKVTTGLPIYVYFSLPEKLEKNTVVNQEGNWQIQMPINVLPNGSHTAYVQAELEGVRSEAYAVATFRVNKANEITTKTWYFIFFVTLAIVILLFAIILQLRRNARDLAPGQLV